MFKNICLHQRTLTLIPVIALFLITFCLLPLQAWAADSAVPSWQGVWEGTIGKSKVTVCLAAHGKSSYKYQRYQTDIPLSQNGDDWEELANGAVSGIWRLSEAKGDSLEGDWRNPKSQHTLPILLQKIAVADSSLPCETRAYKSGMSGDTSAANVSNAAINSGNGKRPEYIYVANQGDDTISAYRINVITGALISIPGSPFKAGRSPSYVAVNPAGTFAYVLNNPGGYENNGSAVNSTISAYRINVATGALTPVAGKPIKAGIGAINATVNSAGTFIYVINNGDSEEIGSSSIASFRIDTATGALTPVRKNPLAVDFHPLSATVNPAGTFAYVTYDGHDNGLPDHGVEVYRINAATGALAATKEGSLQLEGTPTCLTINPAGNFAYVTFNGNDSNDTDGVLVYRINDTTGALIPVPRSSLETDDAPKSIVVNSSGNFAYISNDDGVISTYHINATTGALTLVASTPETEMGTESIVIDHHNTFAYVLNQNGVNNGNILAYRINAATGVLSPINDSSFKTLDYPEYITVNPKGTFVYVTNSGPNNIPAHPSNPNAFTGNLSIHSINPILGSLTPITGKQLTPQGSGLIKINSAGTYAYQFDEAEGAVIVYSVNSTTGVLTTIAGSPYKVGHTPSNVMFDPMDKFVYAVNKLGTVSSYHINAATGGIITGNETSSSFDVSLVPEPYAINSAGTFAYVAKGNGTVLAYRINPSTGLLSPVAGNPYAEGFQPISITVNPAGTFLYVVNEGKPSNRGYTEDMNDPCNPYFGCSISVYHISTTTGELAQIKGSPFATDGLPKSITISPTGAFAYVVNRFGTSANRINATTGALTTVTGSPFKYFGNNKLGGSPTYITINPAGTLAFETNSDNTISVYNIDANTGALSPIGGPFVTGKVPTSFAVAQP